MDFRSFFLTPNILTLIRLIGSPLVLPVLFVYLLPLNVFFLNIVLALFFLILSCTDFLDGYLARKYNQRTELGRMLDPIADKFLLYATLVALLAAGKIAFYWVIVLLGRELFVMGIRQIAAEHGHALVVSGWGKIKTFLQVVTLTVIIVNPYQDVPVQLAWWWFIIEHGLLLLTTAVSVVSAWFYFKEFKHQWLREHSSADHARYSHSMPHRDDDNEL